MILKHCYNNLLEQGIPRIRDANLRLRNHPHHPQHDHKFTVMLLILLVQKSSKHQLRLVVYPSIYKVLAPSQVVLWDVFKKSGSQNHIDPLELPVPCPTDDSALGIHENKEDLNTDLRFNLKIWSNFSDLTRPIFPQKVGNRKGDPRLFQGNLGW